MEVRVSGRYVRWLEIRMIRDERDPSRRELSFSSFDPEESRRYRGNIGRDVGPDG